MRKAGLLGVNGVTIGGWKSSMVDIHFKRVKIGRAGEN